MTDHPMTPSPTRVALRIADGPGPAFLVAAVDAIARIDGVEVVLFLVTDPARERRSVRRRVGDHVDRCYQWIERAALRGGPRALVPTQHGPAPSGATILTGGPHDAHVEALAAASPDVLIDLTPGGSAEGLAIPPGGSWTVCYAVGVGGTRQRQLARSRRPVDLAESLLSIDMPSGQVFESEIGVSALRRIGYGRDRDAIYWRSAGLLARRLERLVGGFPVGSEGVDRLVPPALESTTADRTEPPVVPPFVGLARTLIGKAAERLLFKSGWTVLVRQRESEEELPLDLSGFRPIQAPPGRFYADPFVVSVEGGPRIYVEDCPDGKHRGRIGALRMDQLGAWTLDRVVLDDLDHRAYPHVLRDGARLVLTPDSGRAGGVDIFVDNGPEDGLERIAHCLAGVPVSDPTLLWHDGRYWLFTAVTGHGMSPWDELHCFSAAALDDVWHPHARNPIVADVRRARPAGRIFRSGANLIRPGQDCSTEYGRRIELAAITKLTPYEYEEIPIGSIEPTGAPGVRRTHTYSFDGSTEALDGYRRILRLPGRRRIGK